MILSQPILDIVIYATRLSAAIGAQGPATMLGYLVVSGAILTRYSMRRPERLLLLTCRPERLLLLTLRTDRLLLLTRRPERLLLLTRRTDRLLLLTPRSDRLLLLTRRTERIVADASY